MKFQLYPVLAVIALLATAGLLLSSKTRQGAPSKAGAPESGLREDLFVKGDGPEDLILEEWRWKVGKEARLYRITVFGDVFTQAPGGQIYWLDTGTANYAEVAKSAAQWAELVKSHEEDWFHGKTLRELKARGAKLKEGAVYSWRQAPMVGGVESADNVDFVSVSNHTSYSGRLAYAIKDLPPGTKIDSIEVAPSPGENPDDNAIYTVVINEELQYSFLPANGAIPAGWKSVGKTGTKIECMQYIKKVWTDMRPLSLRKQQDGHGRP